jgi:hypothetical protein
MQMITITIDQKYADVLGAFGNVQDAFNLAIQRYTIEQITTKIAELRQRAEKYEAKYQSDYTTFVERVATDEAFVEKIESDVDITWELDLIEWEFSHKGIDDWTRKLQTILLG